MMKTRLVLVAAPESSTQQQLSTVLSEWGYEPVCVGSREDALPEMDSLANKVPASIISVSCKYLIYGGKFRRTSGIPLH